MNFNLIDRVDYNYQLDIYTIYLNFVDTMNDGLAIYYQPKLHKLTDAGYLEFEYETNGFKLIDYLNKLNKLIKPYHAIFIKQTHPDTISIVYNLKTKDLTDFDFAQFTQAYLSCLTYLNLLNLN